LKKTLGKVFSGVILAGTAASPLPNYLGATGEAISSNNVFIDFFGFVSNGIWGLVMKFVYMICKWVFNIIDLMEMIVKKTAGIETTSGGKSYLTLNHPIFKFLLSDVIITAFWIIVGLAAVLLILFTVIAIVKAEYSEAVQETEKTKLRVYKSALRSVFLLILVPIIFVGSILFSNAVFNGFYHAINGEEYAASSIGGQIFVAASYDANRYRTYADNGLRIPILLNFEDPSNDVYLSTYSPEELVNIYDSWKNGKSIYAMFAIGTFPKFEDTTTYIGGNLYTKNEYSKEFESFLCTREQYYVMADFIDQAVKNNVHFYVKCASDSSVEWSNGGVSRQKIESYSATASTLTVNYHGSNGSTTITYNLGPNNSSTPMQDALSVIYQLLALGDYSDYMFNYLSKVNSSFNTVDWTAEQAIVEIDGSITFLPVYELVLSKYVESLKSYVEYANDPIKAVKLEGTEEYIRVEDEPTLSVSVVKKDAEDEFIVTEGKEYYAIFGYNGAKRFETDENNNIKKDASIEAILYSTENVTGTDSVKYEAKKINRKVTYPEKVLKDLEAIYGNINIDNFINTGNWADALGEYVQNMAGMQSYAVGAFNTSLIHPLGLILAEIFLGKNTQTAENTSFSQLGFESIYSANSTSALIKAICGEKEYKQVYQQLQYYTEFFNMMMAPIIDELAYYEDFDILDVENDGAKLYTYKAYLASQLFSEDLCNYFIRSADRILRVREMINDLEDKSTEADAKALEFYNYESILGNEITEETAGALYKKLDFSEARAHRDTVFWELVYNHYLNQGMEEEEIDELLKKSNSDIIAALGDDYAEEYKYVISPDLGLPEYINSLARYLGIYADPVEHDNLLGELVEGKYDLSTKYYFETGMLKESLIDMSTAEKYTKNVKKMRKEIKDFEENMIENIEMLFLNVFGADATDKIINYIELGASNDSEVREKYDDLMSSLQIYDSSLYAAITHYVENVKKLNQLDKYNLIQALNVYMSNTVNGTYKVVINNKGFNAQINMTTQKYVEIIKGNQSYAASLLPKLNSNVRVKYNNLFKTEKEKLEKAVALSEVTGDSWQYYDHNLAEMRVGTFADVFSSYKEGYLPPDTDDNGNKFWDTLYNLVAKRYQSQTLGFVEDDFEGILINEGNGDNSASTFARLRDFINGFGELCFNLTNKTSFAKLMDTYEDNKITGTVFASKFNEYFETRKSYYRTNTVASMNDIEDVAEFLQFLGVEYEWTEESNLKSLRLAAMETLGSYQARGQDNEAINRLRYLELFYLVCTDYDDTGSTIIVNNASKGAVMKLAGMESRPENELVGLEYSTNFNFNKRDEANGDIFIICVFDETTNTYLPVTNGCTLYAGGKGDNPFTFKTSYCDYGDVVIAKGIFTEKGLPTAIREVNGDIEFYREDPKVVDAISMGIGAYYQSPEEVVVVQTPITIVANKLFSFFGDGETLTEKLLNAIPRVWVDANLYLPYGVKITNLYHLDNGSVEMDYMFDTGSAIEMAYLYRPQDLNIIVLIFGTYFLFTMIGKACWGIIKRLYDIVLLFIIHPLVISTIPLTEMDDKKANEAPFAKWRSMFIERVLVVFGLVLGLTVFFMLANVIENMELIQEGSKFAEDLSQFWFFFGRSTDFMNRVFRVVFLFGAIIMVENAPKLFGTVFGTSDVFSDGDSVKQMVDNNIKDVKEVVNGQLLKDKLARLKKNFENPISRRIKAKRQEKKDRAFKNSVEVARKTAIANGVDPKVADAAAKELNKSYDAMRKEEEAQKMAEDTNLEKREAERFTRHGYMSNEDYTKLEGVGEKEGSRVKKRKKKVKKFVGGIKKKMSK